MKKGLMVYFLGSLLFTMIAAHAQALIITPDTTPQWTGTSTGVSAIFDEWNSELTPSTYVGEFNELYKQDLEPFVESGSFASSYQTVFSNDPDDPANALITYINGTDWITSDPTYLLVKDGKQDPSWYGFDISDWNGTDDISIEGFWPDNGAISHVSIYGAPIPEPATLLLFGAGLAGLAGARLRKRKQ